MLVLAMPMDCLPSDALPFSQGDFTHVMYLEGISKEDLNQSIDILSGYMKNFIPYSMVSLEEANEMIGTVPDKVSPPYKRRWQRFSAWGQEPTDLIFRI